MSDIIVKSTNLDNIVAGKLTPQFSARGDRILRYCIDFRHTKLNLHRQLSAQDLWVLQSKVDALMADWDTRFQGYYVRTLFKTGKDAADEATANAMKSLDSLQRILAHTLTVNDIVDWDNLKDKRKFKRENLPLAKPKKELPIAPKYTPPAIGLLDLCLFRTKRREQEAKAAHAIRMASHEVELATAEQQHESELTEWQWRINAHNDAQDDKEKRFLAEQKAHNDKIDELRNKLAQGHPDAVTEHVIYVLEESQYEDLFEKKFELAYEPDQRLLKIAYDLPGPDDLPSIKAVRFIKATGEVRETLISDRERKANFESVAYQICLRTLHELFEADEAGNIDRILFNGFVEHIDRATGQEVRACLLSALVDRATFVAIDLSRVDPKACFKSLKGVSAASLASLAPIAPIMEMNREDRRFVDSREVASDITNETNIAAMDWEDFEHLVRELFEMEFAARGGDVRVTRASGDGGVDAVAFDPDPISGGKIVIQAKRYTKTVGVSAVRDLYGTVMNEGASKGILVTTADYGPDAYQFANGKPLTLMTGANLLHLLEKHGYQAKIDLKEARAQMQEQ